MPKIAVMICGSSMMSGLIAIELMKRNMMKASGESFHAIAPIMEFEIRRNPDIVETEMTRIDREWVRKQGKKTGHDNFKPPEFHYGSNRIKKRGWGK